MKLPYAILLGLGVSLMLIVIGTLIASAQLLPPGVDWVAHMPGPTYLAATLGLSFGASVLGGYVAASVASAQRFRAAIGVAVGLAVLELVSFVWPFTGQPPFFLWLLPLLALAGALAGGGVRSLAR
jgi:hypothetical protein